MMHKRANTKWIDTGSICTAAVFIFMELALEKSNNFAQLVNKLRCFLVHIIGVLDGENENAHKYSDR